jgi:hypothetical protein
MRNPAIVVSCYTLGMNRMWKQLTPNQVIAVNLRWVRVTKGLTQEEAGKLLEPYLGKRWSQAVFAQAEGAITGKRVRKFDADEVVAFAAAFNVPVSLFFDPPERTERVEVPGAYSTLTRDEMRKLVTDDHRERRAELWEQHTERERREALTFETPAAKTRRERRNRK